MSYRHFVFDLDGTLIDSRQDLADAANAMLARQHLPPLPVTDIVGMVGEGARVLVTRVLARAGAPVDVDRALETFLGEYDIRLAVHTREYDGVSALLAALRDAGCRLSVLTNKPQQATDRVLEALGLRAWFTDILGGDTAHGRKPEPEGLRFLVARAGIGSHETLMVGDSWVDARTAAAAGIDACLVGYGFGYAGVDETTSRAVRWHVDSPAGIMPLAHGHPPAPSTPHATRA